MKSRIHYSKKLDPFKRKDTNWKKGNIRIDNDATLLFNYNDIALNYKN